MTLCLCLGLSGPAHGLFGFGERDPQTAVKQAKASHAEGKINAAIIELRNVLQDNPDNAEVRALLGRWYLEGGDAASAEREFETLRNQAGIPQADVQLGLARAWLQQRQYKRVLLRINRDPAFTVEQNLTTHVLRARAYSGLNLPEEAQKELKRARELKSSYWEISLEHARLALVANDPAAALRWLDKIPSQYRDRIGTQLILAEAYQRNGDLEQAHQALTRVITASPNFTPARMMRAWLNLLKRDTAAAQADIEVVTHGRGNQSLATQYRALSLFIDGKYPEAKTAFSQILANNPGHMLANFMLALSHFAEQEYQQAIKLLEPLVEQLPQAKEARIALAESLIHARRPARAIEHLKILLEQHPNDDRATKLISRAYLALGQLGDTVDIIERSIADNPDDPVLQAQLALSKLARGDAGNIRAELEATLAKDPNNVAVLAALGAVNLQQRRFQPARDALQHALDLSPQRPRLRVLLALTYMAEGDPDAALPHINLAREMQHDVIKPTTFLALLFLQKQNTQAAARLVKPLVDQRPNDANVQNLWGGVLAAQDKRAEAEQAFLRAVDLQPALLAAHINLARLSIARNDFDAARSRYQTALGYAPGNPRVLLLMAELEEFAGDSDAALRHLQAAYDGNPDSAQAALRYTRLLLEQNQGQRAVQVALQSTRRFPQYAQAWRWLGIAQLAAGLKEAARRSLSELIRRAPESPEGYYLRAQIELKDQNYDRARHWLDEALKRDPGNLQATETKARLALRDGDATLALDEAKRLQQARPDNPAGYALEASVLSNAGQHSAAAAAYSEALQRQPRQQYVVARARALAAAGDIAGAETTLRDWLKQHPEHSDAREALGNNLYEQHQLREAAGVFETLLSARPDHDRALNNLAWIYHELQDPRALEYAERAYVLYPHNAGIQDTLGWLLAELGEMSRALELLHKAQAREPNNADYQYHYAAALSRAGRSAEARRRAQQLLKSHPQYAGRAQVEALLAN